MENAIETTTPKKRGWPKLVLAIVLSVVISLAMVLTTLVATAKIPGNPFVAMGVGELAAGLIAALAVVALGGRRWLSVNGRSLGTAFRMSWILLIVPILTIIPEIITALTGQLTIAEGAAMNLLGAAILCLGIGIFEECLCRGVVLGGLLAVMGKSRKGVLAAVLLSSLYFGLIHVGPQDFADPNTAMLAVCKIVQTCMFGIVMCAAVLRSRKLGGAIIFHAINDFLFIGSAALLTGSAEFGNYTTSVDPTYGLVAYGIMVVIFLLPTIRAIRSILKVKEPCMGPFMK